MIGSIGELITMKKIKLSFLILIYSFNVGAAFTEPEMSQLKEINENYMAKAIESRKNLNAAIKESIANLPNEKSNILKLHEIWNQATKIKCRLAILDSLNTDAEIASKYECLANEYTAEANFLNSTY